VVGPSVDAVAASAPASSLQAALAAGAGVGVLCGLIGLGGAEFRLPLLIGFFGFAALQAVIMNKVMSLIVVMTALPAGLIAVPYDTVTGHWFVVVNLLAGSLAGAWIGAAGAPGYAPPPSPTCSPRSWCRSRPRSPGTTVPIPILSSLIRWRGRSLALQPVSASASWPR